MHTIIGVFLVAHTTCMKVNDEAADFFNNFDAGSDDGSSSASNSTRGVRPRVEEDVPIEGSALTMKMCQQCRTYGGTCINPDSSKLIDDEDFNTICSCAHLGECDPKYLPEDVNRPVCDNQQVRYQSVCLLKLTRCSTQKNIQERKCRGNTPITVKYKDQKRSPNLYEEQDIGDPLDFYGDDYEEIPEPTKRNEPTQNPELLIPEIITVQTEPPVTETTTERYIDDGTREAAVIIGIVEGLVFVMLVMVLAYSYIRARSFHQHQPLGSVESATVPETDPVLVPTKIVQ